ncbi:MAG: permease-like cell division protein FtsX [Candidatus Saccharibacteria bacterium]|nr:permease-like cell division protein FtsX [Candidatus Saccharibacteria bacterium]
MSKPKKVNSRVAKQQKLKRRRMLTFARMYRHGVHNFSRNAWLTMAATAVMSVTLLIVFMTVSARQVLLDTAQSISRRVDMSIYLKGSVSDEVVKEMTERLQRLDNVDSVRFISAAEARRKQTDDFKDDPSKLEALKEAVNSLPATLRVSVHDLNDQRALQEFVAQDDLYAKHKDPRQKPSFTGGGQQVVGTIGEWVRVASIGGTIATVIFVIISSLVVFNTIRMAIFNRKDEIQMMKLIGAERSFIRGPFIIEAVMYGVIAAVVATAAGYGLLFAAREPLQKYGLPIETLLGLLSTYVPLVILAMLAAGGLIGAVSAYLATRKYLKL